ncbi:hypothetical protein BMF94_5392 [Rhodotorula taiwanensis]|uniref:Spp2/MOS2 G-patch domain-containing protein n=1 Tax=Rhodotorula taiwanensis TaxID=741276 RepID=A0A2S5B4A8_9BASI|nr:hypothetical protein BMF94_5392 [Rhodotorula taiwanensis]
MSGISFKIQAPPRPSGSASHGGANRPTSLNLSRSASARTSDQSADASSDEDEAGDGMGSVRRNKRTRLLDDGGRGEDEEVVEFGASGAKSKHAKAPTGPLVIAALPNKDWRKAAEDLRANRSSSGSGRRRKEMYLPESSNGSMSMQSGSAGSSRSRSGPREVDAINTEPVVGGLSVGAAAPARPGLPSSGGTEEAVEQVRQEIDAVVAVTTPSLASSVDSPMETRTTPPPPPPSTAAPMPHAALTDEQRALRELLGHDAAAGDEADQVPEAIISAPDNRGGPIDEAEAFKRDVDTRPDEASLEDYARVPVGQFGLAMLRGMGWQPGQAASRSGRGAIEAHVPSARPSLLGIGAKPMAESLGTDPGAGAKGGKGGKPAPRVSKRDEMRFVPLVKKEREGSARAEASIARRQIDSGSSSRRTSRSPPPPGSSSSSRHASRRGSPSRRDYSDRDDRDRDRDRRDRDRDRDSDRRRRDERERDYDSDSRRRRRHEEDGASSSSSYHRSSKREDDLSRSYRSRGDDRRERDFVGDAGPASSSSRRDDRRREGGDRDDRDRRERR